MYFSLSLAIMMSAGNSSVLHLSQKQLPLLVAIQEGKEAHCRAQRGSEGKASWPQGSPCFVLFSSSLTGAVIYLLLKVEKLKKTFAVFFNVDLPKDCCESHSLKNASKELIGHYSWARLLPPLSALIARAIIVCFLGPPFIKPGARASNWTRASCNPQNFCI